MQNDCPEDRFLRDVAGHVMTVLRDDGIYRHLRFRKPDSSDMFFDLITWPGCLCYTGDMGTYVFSRLTDMFQFFRTPDGYKPPDGGSLYVNLGYWAEKVEAVDKPSGLLEYDPDAYREAINDWLKDQVEEVEDESYIAELKSAVEEDLLSVADNGEHEARQAAHDFEFEYGGRCVRLDDFWERTLTRYTGRFRWCCFAIPWAIRLYDARLSPLAVEGT